MNLALMDADYQDDNYWVNKARSLFEEQADDLSNYAAFRGVGSILANDLGQMRVRIPSAAVRGAHAVPRRQLIPLGLR